MLRDQIEKFELTDETLKKHLNEANAVAYLFEGLEFLYGIVKQAEQGAIQQFLQTSETEEGSSEGRTHSVPPSVRVCAFHWYATTACNLVKMIGWIHQMQDSKAETPSQYLEKVLPAIKIYRDKVAAHFSLHTPHRSDTPADNLASLIPPTALVNGRYVAGAYRVGVKRSGQASESQLRPWSLTEVHEELRSRYGPGDQEAE